ncbi:hypothetical protein M9Y10_045639 [Tritrichomonas musculus]|uniref:DUF3447 domain-containing protein n=1 Tax=Tritrichomonas musculus TaxID=1915356 RepID=A0ABR2JXL5_9EUKA
MRASQYIEQRKELYNNILLFLDSNDNIEELYGNLANSLTNKKTNSNKDNFELTLKIINKITKNHHRSPDFIKKIGQIMDLIVENFKKYYFSSLTLFKIFNNNKLILLYLINSDIIEIDSYILEYINNKRFPKSFLLKKYFMKEIYCGLEKELKDFEVKRQIGENDSYICWLIRNDSIEEFVTYVNQANVPLSSKIEQSIYETNDFLIKREETTLIEYSAFCGSIQIFQFLRINNVQLTPSLWLYAIHGRNPEIFFLLEEYKIEPLDKSFIKCFIESIKCHHSEITQYIIDNHIQHFENFMNYFFKYYDFNFIPSKVTMRNIQYFVKNSYYPIVKLLLKRKEFDINTKIILNIYFLIQFLHLILPNISLL